jgi:hypothetical protein
LSGKGEKIRNIIIIIEGSIIGGDSSSNNESIAIARRALSRDKREKLSIVVREKPVVPSLCATISSLALCTFTVSSSDLFESPYMEKSKKKSSVLRFAQQDYDFCSSRPLSSNTQRTLRQSSSLDVQHSSSPSRASPLLLPLHKQQ